MHRPLTTSLLIAVAGAAAAQSYRLTDLGAFSPVGINASGQIAGGAAATEPSYHAFLYANGTLQDLGVLGGTDSRATALNAQGQVAAYSTTDGNASLHASLYANGAMHDLGTLGGNDSFAYGINDSGQVVGYSSVQNVGNVNHAFLYANGTMSDLGTLGGDQSNAVAINAAGQIVGSSTTSDGASHSFLYVNGAMQNLDAAMGISAGTALTINDAGAIAGYFRAASGFSHPYLYANGTFQDLGTLPGKEYAYVAAMNGLGQLVGDGNVVNGDVFGDSDRHALLFSGGTVRDLNDLLAPDTETGWTLIGATGINDSGQIVANARFNGVYRGVLLTPVPEPASVAALGLGVLAVLRRRRRPVSGTPS